MTHSLDEIVTILPHALRHARELGEAELFIDLMNSKISQEAKREVAHFYGKRYGFSKRTPTNPATHITIGKLDTMGAS